MTELATHTLEALAAEANEEHRAAEVAMNAALTHAIKAGQLLLAAKGRVPHGGWGAWLAANIAFSARTAQAYMRLASRLPELESKAQRVADLPLREALKILAVPKEPATSGPPILQQMIEALEELEQLKECFSRDADAELDAIVAMAPSLDAAMVRVQALVDNPLRSRTLTALYDHIRRCDEYNERVLVSASEMFKVPVNDLRSWTPREWGEIRKAAEERMEALR